MSEAISPGVEPQSRTSRRKALFAATAAFLAAIAIAAISGARNEAPERNPAFGDYTPQAVDHVFRLARSAGTEPTGDEVLSVVQFRHSCQVVASFANSRGAGDSRARLEALPDEAGAIGQPEAAQFFADHILPAAQAGDWGPLESFVSNECDPNQDMKLPLRK